MSNRSYRKRIRSEADKQNRSAFFVEYSIQFMTTD